MMARRWPFLAALVALTGAVAACNAILGIKELGPEGAEPGSDASVDHSSGGPGPAVDGGADGFSDNHADAATDATVLAVADAGPDAQPSKDASTDAPPPPVEAGCGSGLVECDGGCASLSSIHSCGACGNDCAALTHVDVPSLACSGGRCAYACQSGYSDCASTGNGCATSLAASPTCGSCTGVCGQNTACGPNDAGTYACLSTCPANAPTLCASGQTSQCVNQQTDNNNCGGCGPSFACTGNKTCIRGSCGIQISVAGSPFSATQNIAFSGTVATVTDLIASDTTAALTVIVDWGDGAKTTGTLSGSSGSFTVSGSHTYATNGSLTVTVTVSDAATGATGSATLAANVGVCTPSTKQCANGTPQQCDSTGHWQNLAACTNGFTCSSGSCVCTRTTCGSSCVDTNTDQNNCATCGNVCIGGCSAAKCQCVAPGGTNLLANGGFDTNVTGWTPFDPAITLAFSKVDAAQCTTSGSVLASNTAANGLNSGFYQCVPVSAGASYDVGAWVRVPSGGAQGQTFIQLAWFTGPGCTGSISLADQLTWTGAFDTWQLLSADGLVAPAGTVSAYVYGQIIKNFPNSLSYQTYYDMMYLSPSPGHF
jgi:hypothetical protein